MEIDFGQIKKKIQSISDTDPSKLRLNADGNWAWLVAIGISSTILAAAFSYLVFFEHYDRDVFVRSTNTASSTQSKLYSDLQTELRTSIEKYDQKQEDFNDLLMNPPKNIVRIPVSEISEEVKQDGGQATSTEEITEPLSGRIRDMGSQAGSVGAAIIDWLGQY